MQSTKSMRDRARELASPPRDDFDRAVLAILDDFDILAARVELLREAHDLANGALRSSMSVAERDGRETNWPAYRATLRASLEASHAAINALISAPNAMS